MTLSQLFARAVKKSVESSRLRGHLGLPDPDNEGQYFFEVENYPEYYHYVRVVQGSETTVIAAINLTVGRIPDQAVIVDRTQTGEHVVVGLDEESLGDFAGSAAPYVGGAGIHTHRIGFGNEDMVEGRRLEPGLVHADDALTVYIEPFHYVWQTVRKYWPGGLLDLTSYRPATANTWRWVLVCVAPSDNSATAVAGTDYSTISELTDDILADISAPGLIPLDGVKLREGQTSIDEEDDFACARPIITGLGSPGSGDSLLWLSM
jgi:hypothetical protein